MINRLFKTIFILSLCLGITLPSNAGSVQVSDGSAFVSKSELSYELNNISRRMEQLENSLDSRIDTLVSSYLTRNGIWNGVDVDIDKSDTRLVGTDFIDSWSYGATVEKVVWSKTAITTKSGMLFAIVHIEGRDAGYNLYRCYLRYGGGVWAGFEDDARILLYLDEEVNGVYDTRSKMEISSSQLRTIHDSTHDEGAATGSHILTMPLNNDYVLVGFVSKGNRIRIEMLQYVADFTTIGSDKKQTEYGFYKGAYLLTKITDCKIY